MKDLLNRILVPLIFAVPGIVLVLINMIVHEPVIDVIAGVLFGIGFCVFLRPQQKGKRSATTQQQAQQYQPQATQTLPIVNNPLLGQVEATVAREAAALQKASALGTEFLRKKWSETEKAVDEILDMFINMLAGTFSSSCTIAVFFPAPGEGYSLRRIKSTSDYIDGKAKIVPNEGFLGRFLDGGYLPNFTNPMKTLYYYDESHAFTPEEHIHSITLHHMGANEDTKGGLLLLDSTTQDAYTEDERKFLDKAAKLLGVTVYNTYKNTENSIAHLRLKAMSSLEKDFWTTLELDEVLNKMLDTIPHATPCDRLTISLKDEGKMSAAIKRVYGTDSEGLLKLPFPLGNDYPMSIANTAYERGVGFFRNFGEDRYEIRYAESEPKSGEFASFIAMPFGMESVKGLILLESVRKDAFSKFHRDLLEEMGKSAGIALEKIFMVKQVKDMAIHDSLTGLYNRRRCVEFLKSKIKAYERRNLPLTLVMCDIDFFKKINDTYGHDTGDIVIKGVAARLQNSIRLEIDVAARFGGEEFVLVFDEMDHEKASESTERIREAIESMPFYSTGGQAVKVTMSFGIASYPQHAADTDGLLRNADKALYDAKKGGRNRVVVY
jgi:diguanylate cyclase (GGDEF)-like protein